MKPFNITHCMLCLSACINPFASTSNDSLSNHLKDHFNLNFQWLTETIKSVEKNNNDYSWNHIKIYIYNIYDEIEHTLHVIHLINESLLSSHAFHFNYLIKQWEIDNNNNNEKLMCSIPFDKIHFIELLNHTEMKWSWSWDHRRTICFWWKNFKRFRLLDIWHLCVICIFIPIQYFIAQSNRNIFLCWVACACILTLRLCLCVHRSHIHSVKINKHWNKRINAINIPMLMKISQN